MERSSVKMHPRLALTGYLLSILLFTVPKCRLSRNLHWHPGGKNIPLSPTSQYDSKIDSYNESICAQAFFHSFEHVIWNVQLSTSKSIWFFWSKGIAMKTDKIRMSVVPSILLTSKCTIHFPQQDSLKYSLINSLEQHLLNWTLPKDGSIIALFCVNWDHTLKSIREHHSWKPTRVIWSETVAM